MVLDVFWLFNTISDTTIVSEIRHISIQRFSKVSMRIVIKFSAGNQMDVNIECCIWIYTSNSQQKSIGEWGYKILPTTKFAFN